MTIYLDHAATTPIRPEALAAMDEAMRLAGGNASGTHAVARAAKNLLEESRERAAVVIGARRPDEIVFTSGGTESDNMAVAGVALAGERRTVVISAIEHKAVSGPSAALGRWGFDTVEVGCDRDGVVDPVDVAASVGVDTAVVSVMAANNEVGTVQPVADIAAHVRAAAPDTIVHTDAVQAFVGSDPTVRSTGADLLTLSAHKFGGPKGVGLLYVRSGVRIEPIVHGGGHEAGRRPGTSNVAGIAGMVAAMEAASAQRQDFAERVSAERDDFEHLVAEGIPGVIVNGRGGDRMPHFSNLRFPGVSAESLLIRLDQAGLCAAAGSACQSGAIEPSHVLTAMGMTEREAAECVRFSFGWDTEEGVGVRAGALVVDVVGELL